MVGLSGLKLNPRLGNFSVAAIWRARSYIEPFSGFAPVGLADADARSKLWEKAS
jgi:hypothetical protein